MPVQLFASKFACRDSFKGNYARIFCVILFVLTSTASLAEETPTPMDPELKIHIDLVENALVTDAYNKHCRGISVAKDLNKVNRLYVTKYSLTVNNFIKKYIDADVRAVKADRELDFKRNLSKMGGCRAAKAEGSVKQLTVDFKKLYEQAEKSPWFPE